MKKEDEEDNTFDRTGQTLMAFTVEETLKGINDFSHVVL